jgi:endothelin-converting enzyme/putative endopeptidase
VKTLLALGFVSVLAAQTPAPLSRLPYSPSLDVTSMDRSVDPCTDFFRYSCGAWIKKNPIPPDESHWDVYSKLAYDNEQFLWGILDEAAKKTEGRSAIDQKIGDYFHACMDEGAIGKAGASPLQPDLDAIAHLSSGRALAALVASEQLGGTETLFGFGSNQDFENSEQVIAFAVAGGLGLPDRDYYVQDDPKMKEIREKYVAHVGRMFELLGDAPKAAAAEAATVMAIETALAKASLTRVEQRDPHNLFHKMTLEQVKALAPSFDWDAYLAKNGAAGISLANVTEPAFFKELERQLQSQDLANWKAYLRWHLVHSKAPYLSSKFVDENFAFFSKTLRGIDQLQPRWKRCVRYVDRDLGEALGQAFVAKTFGPDVKAKTLEMTRQIEKAMEGDIQDLAWMGPESKQQALLKLHTMVNKIGYPDKWRDYSSVRIAPDDFAGDVGRAATFEMHRDLGKIGKPVDRTEWGMTPPTVNAYYNGQMRAPAAAFRFQAGRCAKLRQHRRHHRARADARLRRRGAQLRCQGQPARLVDQEGLRGLRRAHRLRGRSVRAIHRDRQHQDQLQVDPGRGCRRPRRHPSGLHCLEERHARPGPPAHRRIHARPALLHRHGAVGLRGRAPREQARARGDRPALAPGIPHQRRGVQHARIRPRLRLQNRPAHGESESVPGLVATGSAA